MISNSVFSIRPALNLAVAVRIYPMKVRQKVRRESGRGSGRDRKGEEHVHDVGTMTFLWPITKA